MNVDLIKNIYTVTSIIIKFTSDVQVIVPLPFVTFRNLNT